MIMAAWCFILLAAFAVGSAQKERPLEDCSRIQCAMPRCLPGYFATTVDGNCCPSCERCPARPCPLLACERESVRYSRDDPCGCPVCLATPETDTPPTTPLVDACETKGQEFMECGTACPAVCGEEQPLFCTVQCVRGCQCPRGTFLNRPTSECVPECPTTLVPPTMATTTPEVDPTTNDKVTTDAMTPTQTRPIPETDPTTTTDPGAPNFCSLRQERGPCRAMLRRFYYNPTSRRCEPFVFGGCRGNGNNFRNLRDCYSTCRVTAKPTTTAPAVPTKPSLGTGSTPTTPGTGSAPTKPHTTDSTPHPGSRPPTTDSTGSTPTRPAGGTSSIPTKPVTTDSTGSTPTGGTGSIPTKPATSDITGSIPTRPTGGTGSTPTKPATTGGTGSTPTKPATTDTSTAPTKPFTGTEFTTGSRPTVPDKEVPSIVTVTATETEATPTTVDLCTLKRDKGQRCLLAPLRRYYYNSSRNKCRAFAYGGCEGNANRFNSREDCKSACM